jgi:Carboxypeptidase regulatory-like domain
MRARIVSCSTHLLAAFLVLAAASPPAGAQSDSARGVVDGVVTDTSLVPLADAVASIVGSGIQVVTGANGRFQIHGLPTGRHYLLIRRLGYQPASTELRIIEGDTVRASFALERIATALDTVVVAAKRRSARLAEFEARRSLGIGQFMTAAEIDKLNVVATDDLLHRLTPNRTRPARRLGPGAACERQQWYLDGVLLPPSTTLDDLPSPKELAGIEFYASPATIPVQYKSSSGAGFCGMVLMWTKDGY